MLRLDDKHILLGITGSISAYKSASIASHLTQLGAKVDVVMTQNACKLITPAVFEALTHRRVYTETFSTEFTGEVDHIAVARRADLVLIAPCSANMLAKLASGIADDMLSSTMLAVTAPVWLSPAMNAFMFENPATQHNLKVLQERGFHIIEPDSGNLACGTSGRGRMPDPDKLVEIVVREAALPHTLQDKHVLITAGATREFLDPVRFLSNPSTGKMGVACARAALALGARVTLVAAHIDVEPPLGAEVINVVSAQDMAKTVTQLAPKTDIVIMTAAVSDFTPAQCAEHKVHKTDAQTHIAFVPTTDILKTLGQTRSPNTYLCGFCMETQDLLERAHHKLTSKNVDMIVANSLNQSGCGFKHDTNSVTIVTQSTETTLPLMSKDEIARHIFEEILKDIHAAE